MTDQQLDQVIGKLLRAGVLLSAAVVLAGGIWLLVQLGGTPSNFRHFEPPPATLRSAGGIIAALAHPNPREVIQFGLLLLVATPVARVVLSVIAFAIQRDRLYVVLTLIVLAVLAYSLAIPH